MPFDLFPLTHLAGNGRALPDDRLAEYARWFATAYDVKLTWDGETVTIAAEHALPLDRRDPSLGIRLAIISLQLAELADLEQQNALNGADRQGVEQR